VVELLPTAKPGEAWNACPETTLRWLRRGRFAGCIFVYPHARLVELGRELRARGQAVALLAYADPQVPHVTSDGAGAMADAVARFAAAGRRRIAFMAGPSSHPEAVARQKAWSDGLLRAGLEQDPALRIPAEFDELHARRSLRSALQAGLEFDAVLAANDFSGFGAQHALAERGLGPDQVPVIGYDDHIEARHRSVPLASYRFSPHRMGREAMRLVAEQISGKGAHENLTALVPTQFVWRASAGPVVDDTVAPVSAAGESAFEARVLTHLRAGPGLIEEAFAHDFVRGLRHAATSANLGPFLGRLLPELRQAGAAAEFGRELARLVRPLALSGMVDARVAADLAAAERVAGHMAEL
jgi:hypothetical protein